MRIMIVRHCDPDYTIDSLTEKGWREAELLADRLSKLEYKAIYCSPLGRAKDTASITLKRIGRTAEIKPWLREFSASVDDPETGKKRDVCWDLMPGYWTSINDMYDRNGWSSTPIMKSGDAGKEYKWVADGLDSILAENGYIRKDNLYIAERSNRDTLLFFCHFGVECVMLSHLTGVSPVIYWHHFAAAPSSVTTLYTEEREKGIVSFRCSQFGDISHLYAAGEEPSFSARFCETFDSDERH